MTEAVRIVTAATGATTYEAELRKPGEKVALVKSSIQKSPLSVRGVKLLPATQY